MSGSIELLDVVALTVARRESGLVRGQVGTVVEALDVDVFEVEFADAHGRAYACEAIPEADLMVLHHEPSSA